MPTGQLPPQKRAAVLAAIKGARTTGVSLRSIAEKHGVSTGTVRNIATAAGIEDAFDRSKTAAATAARSIDCRAAREKLKQELLADAERLRGRAWSRYETIIDSRTQGPTTVGLDLPPLADVRAAYAAIGLALDKSMRLEQYDTSDNADAAKSMLGSLSEALKAAAESLPDPETSTE
jgi:hypothetical protein